MARDTRRVPNGGHLNKLIPIHGEQTPIAIKYDPTVLNARGEMVPIKVYAPVVTVGHWIDVLEDLVTIHPSRRS